MPLPPVRFPAPMRCLRGIDVMLFVCMALMTPVMRAAERVTAGGGVQPLLPVEFARTHAGGFRGEFMDGLGGWVVIRVMRAGTFSGHVRFGDRDAPGGKMRLPLAGRLNVIPQQDGTFFNFADIPLLPGATLKLRQQSGHYMEVVCEPSGPHSTPSTIYAVQKSVPRHMVGAYAGEMTNPVSWPGRMRVFSTPSGTVYWFFRLGRDLHGSRVVVGSSPLTFGGSFQVFSLVREPDEMKCLQGDLQVGGQAVGFIHYSARYGNDPFDTYYFEVPKW